MKFVVLAIVIGVILWMLVSAEMTYIRADKQKKNMMNKKQLLECTRRKVINLHVTAVFVYNKYAKTEVNRKKCRE